MHLKHKNLIFLAVLIVVCLLAFGLQISKLGFYLDDWVILQALNQDGVDGITAYAAGDSRPFVAWVWVVGYYLFGSTAAGWQLYSLFFRVLTAFTAWLILDRFFPLNPARTIAVALLFFVYPIFRQQSASLAFAFQWISFAFFLLSIYLQIVALEKKSYLNFWLLMALILNGVQLFTNEYFLAMELARPLIIGLFLYQQNRLNRSDWKKFILIHLPFLLVLVIFLLWRFYFLDLPVEDRNAPFMLEAFWKTPVYAVRRWFEMFLQSTVEGLLGSWYQALEPTAIVFKPLRKAFSWMLIIVTTVLLIPTFYFLRRYADVEENRESKPWYFYGMVVGIILMALGFVPGWGIGRTIADTGGMYNDRFGLPAALGASLLVVSLVEGLINGQRAKLIVLAVLISIGVGYQHRLQTEYVDSWLTQKDVAWQLQTRVPALQPHTAIVSNRVIAKFTGSWADVSAINQLYDPTKVGETHAYWYFTVGSLRLDDLPENDAIYRKNKFLAFEGNARDIVVIMNPTPTTCLWILNEDDDDNPYIDPVLFPYLPYSNIERILPVAESKYYSNIWGASLDDDWCVFYNRAKLAEQEANWQEVIRLYDQALEKNFKPQNHSEYAPFIRAYAMQQQWEQAADLTETARVPMDVKDRPLEGYLCSLWRQIRVNTGGGPEADEVLDQMACHD
jgi:hypothetical protein